MIKWLHTSLNIIAQLSYENKSGKPELHKQAEIKKETQDKVEILDRALAKTQDEETKKKLEDAKEMVKT